MARNVSKKRHVWDYLAINPEELLYVTLVMKLRISRGGVSTKLYNKSNLQYHLWQEHSAKFGELRVNKAERIQRSDQNEVEQDLKQRKLNICQLTLAEGKETRKHGLTTIHNTKIKN